MLTEILSRTGMEINPEIGPEIRDVITACLQYRPRFAIGPNGRRELWAGCSPTVD
jgi:hypothetical protein